MDTAFVTLEETSVSFVIPFKDEEATLEKLFQAISDQVSKITRRWEVIFVDDGSVDGGWSVVQRLAVENPDIVKAIRFRRNMGKAHALAMGWKECTGDFVFTMDADLQDDPEEIPRFLEKMQEGWDIVTGWKRRRFDPWHKVLPSRVFNLMLSKVNKVDLHDHNCGFKCYRREVVESIPMYGEMHRMVPSLAAIHGYRTVEIPVKHHPRVYGRSKYGFKRFLRGFLDMWTVNFLQNFRHRPFHFFGSIAVAMIGIGFFIAVLLLLLPLPANVTLLFDTAPPMLMVGGLITVLLGLLAEWNVHESIGDTKLMPIAETIGVNGNKPALPWNELRGTNDVASGPAVLLIERDRTSRESHAAHLRKAGWSVIQAGSCADAQARMVRSIAVLLLDFGSGSAAEMIDLIRLAREASPQTRIIFLLSESDASSIDISQLEPYACLYKPIEPTSMVELALNALNRQVLYAQGA
jgi:glycosyltransferase involved in cell wall biosynthesis/CheY-like chemotaxis protein